MSRNRPDLLAVAVLAVTLTLVLGLALAGPATSAPTHTTTGLHAEQQAMVPWALELFDEGGLPLPPLDVVGHATTDACSGRRAAHTWSGGRSTIHVCSYEVGPADHYRLLHELAHAWDRVGLDDRRRMAFLELRGLREWRNDDPDRWHERGAEHAAEIIVWGLMDRPVRSVFIPDTTCADLLAGYVVLTGQPPLHGFTDRC